MLGQVNPTPFDLYFPLFGIPVRITPWFWLAGTIMGFGLISGPEKHWDLLLVWLGCLFLSILVHEMGHALAGKMFGWPSDVILYHFGGVARFPYRTYETMGRSVAVSFAGPWAGFVLYGIVLLVELGLKQNPASLNKYTLFAILQLKWINLYWGLINLLPVLPLDGGQISRAILERYRRNGTVLCLQIGMVVGGVAAAFFFWANYRYAGILFALLAVDNFQQYDQIRSRW